VRLPNIDGPVPSSSSIRYNWLTVTNEQMKVDLLKDEYFCSAQVFDSNGQHVPFREKFANLGVRFFDLEFPSKERPSSEIQNYVRFRSPHGTQQAVTDEFVIASKDIGGGG